MTDPQITHFDNSGLAIYDIHFARRVLQEAISHNLVHGASGKA